MKPVTKLHHKVVDANKKIKRVTSAQERYAFKHGFEPLAMIQRSTIFCLECGGNWKDKSLIEKKKQYDIMRDKTEYSKRNKLEPFSAKCPCCKKKVLFSYYDNGAQDSFYFKIIDNARDFQVYRLFECVKYMKKNQKPKLLCVEVVREFIDTTTGSYTVMAVPCSYSYYGYKWTWGKMEIKRYNIQDEKYNIKAYVTYNKKNYHKSLLEKNYFGDNYGFNEKQFLSALCSSPIFETILKKNNRDLIDIYLRFQKRFIKFWPSIKIALRNNYEETIIKHSNSWFDYIDLLYKFNKDLRSPNLICPKDLHTQHDIYVKRMRKIQKTRDLQKTIEQMEKDQIVYNETKGKFFDLEFRSESENLVIKTITEIHELMKESDILSHCAFTNKYHKQKDSLLMSAYYNNVVIKTIEIDLGSLRINQCRGYRNDVGGDVSGKQKEVMKLLKDNMYQIKNILYPKTAKKQKSEIVKESYQHLAGYTNQYQRAV